MYKAKGILARFLEKAIVIFLKKECKKINEIEINFFASSIQIIKGFINKIHIKAKGVNYRDFLFDEIELEANDVKVNFKLRNKKLDLKNNFKVKFRILLNQKSLKSILILSKWKSIGDLISKKILNIDKLDDVEIENGQIQLKGLLGSHNKSKIATVNIYTKKGKVYLRTKDNIRQFEIPIEDKIYIKEICTNKESIIIFGSSHISF